MQPPASVSSRNQASSASRQVRAQPRRRQIRPAWNGSDLDTYADLAELIGALNLHDTVLVPPLMLTTGPIPAGCRSTCSTTSGPASPRTGPSFTRTSARPSTALTVLRTGGGRRSGFAYLR